MEGPAPGAVVTTRLRPPHDGDDELVKGWAADPTSPFEDWSGDPPPGTTPGPRAGPPEGGGRLMVSDGDDVVIGTVSWRQVLWGPAPGSAALEIGISLRPHVRGRGHGSRAQRLLADYLFSTTAVHRVQATTDVENVAEQRALESAGFRREGVLRQAQWRLGAWHDLAMYGRLRSDD